MTGALAIRAGRRALERIRAEGFDRDSFSSLVGASGGPKWLVLSKLDRVLCKHLLAGRTEPLAMLGSSIGTFRHACFAQHDPLAALARFEDAYVGQAYEREPTAREVTEVSREILGVLLGHQGSAEIIANKMLKTNIVAARGKSLLESESRPVLMAGLAVAASANAVARGFLGAFFDRVVFCSGPPDFHFSNLSTWVVPLTEHNLEDAILASGSIPLVMAGIRDIGGAPPGTYRDGGIVDYHFDFSFDSRDGLILYPHFYERIVPGWFDKSLVWRRPAVRHLEDVVMIAPSRGFIEKLPGGTIPDRTDFREFSTAARQDRWREVLARCEDLAEELDRLIDENRIDEVVRRFDG